jgi:hypothetical protein
MKILRFCIIVLVLIFTAGVLWLYLHHLFYRRTVLKVPIRFEEGFSFKRQFTVDTPVTYWVAIQYDDIFRSSMEIPVPRDELTAEFEVTSRDRLIAKGGTASAPDWSGGGPAPWSSNKDHVTRYLDSFSAEPGKPYQVSLRITSVRPRLVSKKPNAMIVVDWHFDEFRYLRNSLLFCGGAAISILILLEPRLSRSARN